MRIDLFTFSDAVVGDAAMKCQDLDRAQMARLTNGRALQRERDYLYDMPRVF